MFQLLSNELGPRKSKNTYLLRELVELCDSAGFVNQDPSRGFRLNDPHSPSQMYQTEEPTESRAESLQHSVPNCQQQLCPR